MERRHVSLVGPTLLIGLGMVLLLNNLGYLDWGLWDVARLWPILLIAAGLEVVLGRRSVWASLIASLIVLALVVGGVWLADSAGRSSIMGDTRELSYPLEGAERATILLEPAIGDLTVTPLTDSPNLLEADIALRGDEHLAENYVSGTRARLTISSASGKTIGYRGLDREATWEIAINPDVRLDLVVDMGVGEADLNLAGLTVSDVRADLGVGRVAMSLPATSDASINVDGGIGTVHIEVPPSLGVRVLIDAGISGHHLPPGYVRDGDTYTSPGYDSADRRADVTVSLGIGTISIAETANP